jgi:hypothetical protein
MDLHHGAKHDRSSFMTSVRSSSEIIQSTEITILILTAETPGTFCAVFGPLQRQKPGTALSLELTSAFMMESMTFTKLHWPIPFCGTLTVFPLHPPGSMAMVAHDPPNWQKTGF